MWFNESDILKHFKSFSLIELQDLNGYVLPHAGTEYTGQIIAHTMRFKPTKKFSKVYILFYPANSASTSTSTSNEKMAHEMAHEYEVPYKSCLTIFEKIWKINTQSITFIPYNIVTTTLPRLSPKEYRESLVIVSADFSHFLDLQTAYQAENCAANSILHNALGSDMSTSPPIKCTDIIDHRDTFVRLYSFLPSSVRPILQWVGRTRSPGKKGVGYLSFLLRDEHIVANSRLPDGMFVTCYDTNMTARECLGKWFDERIGIEEHVKTRGATDARDLTKFENKNKNKKWSKKKEQELIADVVRKGKSFSRLTGGRDTHVPIKYCTITYLYRDDTTPPERFIRGWHGLLTTAFYLPDVFLENTFDNGKWITASDNEWRQDYNFKLDDTLASLDRKAGVSIGTSSRGEKKLYTSGLRYVKL
jgi:hypothetical protein